MEGTKLKAARLMYMDISGSGKEIQAMIVREVECVEFTKLPGPQVVMHPKAQGPMRSVIGYEPWIQFGPPEWTGMIEETFQQMVDLWNEKNATISEEEALDFIKSARGY